MVVSPISRDDNVFPTEKRMVAFGFVFVSSLVKIQTPRNSKNIQSKNQTPNHSTALNADDSQFPSQMLPQIPGRLTTNTNGNQNTWNGGGGKKIERATQQNWTYPFRQGNHETPSISGVNLKDEELAAELGNLSDIEQVNKAGKRSNMVCMVLMEPKKIMK
ncbi:hypothetical protein NPIL_582951 [Nephila pilipes]|uniref:Uncharacterized protein n=1 Tax=Nephila pilipes TaxID=299642 RepID=A0A8X6PBE6_NEPPI|nr:hypothetical protein NPIL_582951 [Nephila pilipes]